MNAPSPLDLAKFNSSQKKPNQGGLPQDFNKKDSEVSTHKRSSTGARRTTRQGKDTSRETSENTARSPRKAKTQKTGSKSTSKNGERKMGYRNQPLKDHEGLKALQEKMNNPDLDAAARTEINKVVSIGKIRSVSLDQDGLGHVNIVQSNHVPPHQDYTRDQLIRKIEQDLMKGTN